MPLNLNVARPDCYEIQTKSWIFLLPQRVLLIRGWRKMDKRIRYQVSSIYEHLLDHFGPRYWWPADTPFEVIVGAVLTQAVSWKNAKKAIDNLKSAQILNIKALSDIGENQLAEMLKPALYHRQKSKKIKALISFINGSYGGSLDLLLGQDWKSSRPRLLEVWGLGPETVDSILLYAGGHPVFVVDAYTRRIMNRQGLVEENISYADLQAFMTRYSQPRVEVYNEFHALIVGLGAAYCRKSRPFCHQCPISAGCKYLAFGQDKIIGR